MMRQEHWKGIAGWMTLAGALAMSSLLCGCGTPQSQPAPSYAATSELDREFEHGAKRKPIAQTLHAVARLLISQGRDAEAEPILRRTMAEHPRYVPAYLEAAELHMRNRRLGQAMETLTAALAVAETPPLEWASMEPTLRNNIGMCWLLRGEYGRALEQFTQAAALDPQDARYRANMAAALGMQGRYGESFALYEQVVGPAEAHYNLGVLSRARDDQERAAIEFEAAKRLNPRMKPPTD
jgi:tetratricopeptide (TPR) repeat protein